MDCYSPRKNMNTGRPGFQGKTPGAAAPNFQPVSPAQPVFKQQTVETASCGCGNVPPFTVPANPPMGGSCQIMPQMPEPKPVIPQMPGPVPIMPQVSGPGPVLPPESASCTNTAPGCLEQNYPIAMAYVPWQQWRGVYSMPQVSGPGPVLPPESASCTNTAPGCLEQNYPIAMAYVPWQQWRGVYSMEQGFKRGTIFPELDLPFEPRRCRL